MLKRNLYVLKKEVNKSELKGLYQGDAFGDPYCSWGDRGGDHRAWCWQRVWSQLWSWCHPPWWSWVWCELCPSFKCRQTVNPGVAAGSWGSQFGPMDRCVTLKQGHQKYRCMSTRQELMVPMEQDGTDRSSPSLSTTSTKIWYFLIAHLLICYFS